MHEKNDMHSIEWQWRVKFDKCWLGTRTQWTTLRRMILDRTIIVCQLNMRMPTIVCMDQLSRFPGIADPRSKLTKINFCFRILLNISSVGRLCCIVLQCNWKTLICKSAQLYVYFLHSIEPFNFTKWEKNTMFWVQNLMLKTQIGRFKRKMAKNWNQNLIQLYLFIVRSKVIITTMKYWKR